MRMWLSETEQLRNSWERVFKSREKNVITKVLALLLPHVYCFDKVVYFL